MSSSISFTNAAILFLTPLGGSLVNFIPFYKTDTGNLLVGAEVSQSLYSGWVSASTYPA